jgi:hypothetical protein
MYSSLGQVLNVSVSRSATNNVTMDTRQLTDGIYILQIALKENIIISKKLMISHK